MIKNMHHKSEFFKNSITEDRGLDVDSKVWNKIDQRLSETEENPKKTKFRFALVGMALAAAASLGLIISQKNYELESWTPDTDLQSTPYSMETIQTLNRHYDKETALQLLPS